MAIFVKSRNVQPIITDALADALRIKPESVADVQGEAAARGARVVAELTTEIAWPRLLIAALLSRRNLLRRQLQPVAAKLGMGRIGWHWLRHANATLLDAVGAPLGTVQALLGHSSGVTREVYLHSVPADARRAVEGVEKLIGPKWTQLLESGKLGSRLIQ